MTITLCSNNGVPFIISGEDYQAVSKHQWRADTTGYIRNRSTNEMLHRFIMRAKKGEIIDHKDRNPHNNTRENLRRATPSNNRTNSKKMRRKGKAHSRYKGVTKKLDRGRKRKCWQAQIGMPKTKRVKLLGTFTTEIQAARAYDQAALQLHGEFACTNESLYGRYWYQRKAA